jgi:MFS family permease
MYDKGTMSSMVGGFWLIYIVSAVVLGIVVGFIGREKGRSGWGWFWAGVFLSVLGLIAVCAVPRLEKRARVSQLDLGNAPVVQVRQEGRVLETVTGNLLAPFASPTHPVCA